MAETITPSDADARMQRAKDRGVPQLYFNGFLNSVSAGDVTCVAERNGEPVAIMNFSYTVAKTLALSLGSLIAALEEKAGRDIMTTHDVDRIFKDDLEEK